MWKSGLAALALAVFASPAVIAEEPAIETVATDANLVTAKVNGMVCDFCARSIMSMFGKEDAVDTVEVDLDEGEIRIGMKAGQTLSDERVAELVKKSGYSLVEILRADA